MTAYVWKQLVFFSVLLRGNAYVEIEYAGNGWPVALWPLRPDGMQAQLKRREPVYRYTAGMEDPAASNGLIADHRIHHLRSLSSDGFLGRSVVRQAMHTLELALGTEEFGARFFGQDATPGVVLMHPETLSPDAKDNLQRSFDKRHSGVGNAHKTAILEEGMQAERIGVPPEEAQFLETRQFQVLEICRWFGVPPHMAYELTRATFSNIEHQSIAFVQDSLLPWIVNHEEQLLADVIEREGYESNVWAEYVLDGRLRGDTTSRYRVYQIGVMYGLMSRNEARAKENMPAYTGGDEMLMPTNLAPASKVAEGEEGEEEEKDGGMRQQQERGRNFGTRDDVQELREIWGRGAKTFTERLEGVVAYETAAVQEALDGGTVHAFVRWLSVFFGDEVPQIYIDALSSSLVDLAGWTAAAVVASLEEEWTVEIAESIEAFAAEALETEANGYAASHRRQLEALIRDEGGGEGEQAARIAVEERLLGWSENEAAKRGRKAAFEVGNAIALAAMGAVGIALVAWAARGESCQYCRALDGKTVAVGGDFVAAGGSVSAEDGESLQVSGKRKHPPLHGGCDCGVRAVRES